MRKSHLLVAGAAVAVAILSGLAGEQAKKAINRKCPIKPAVRVDPAITVVHNGKVVGLC